MSKQTNILYSLTLTIGISLWLAVDAAYATKLVAPPLPHEGAKNFENGEEVVIPPSATRYKRRPDYRELELEKKKQEEEAAKNAEEAKKQQAEAARKAQQDQADAANKTLQQAMDFNNQAVALGKQGRWQEAIAAHEKACQYDPRNKQYRINLSAARTAFGQQRMANRDFSTASSLLRKALAAAPDNGLAGRCLVDCLKKMGLNPSSSDERMGLGDQLAAAGDFEGANIEYQAAMQLEPSARTYIKMGDMAFRYGQITQCVNWYRQAIVKDPDCGAAHRQLGFLQMSQRDYTAAAASLRKAVILDCKDTAAGQALVDLWRKQVATNPLLAENHLGLAGALQLTGDFNGADSEYRKLEQLDPKNPGLESGRASLTRAIQHVAAEKHKMAAETLFNQGLRREALIEINQAVAAEPKNANYRFLLGECLEAVGDYKGAHQAYLTCVLIDPENNKEAAARMRQMQEGMKANGINPAQLTSQVANQIATQYSKPAQAPQVQQIQQPAASEMSAPAAMTRKNMFEGGSGMTAPNAQLGFRTHDESQEASMAAAAPQAMAPQAQAAAQAPAAQAAPRAAAETMGVNDIMAKVTDAEAQKDYNTAIALLRQTSTANLQNPELHHRLAINLMAAGQLSEAISEFRIASALCPGKKIYADDLARAMAIHKRSLMSDAKTDVGSADGVTGASK